MSMDCVADRTRDPALQEARLEYRRAYAETTRLVFGIGVVLALVGAGVSLLIPKQTATKPEEGTCSV